MRLKHSLHINNGGKAIMARSEICKVCCPEGGAIFDVVSLTEKVCRNCGAKKPRRMTQNLRKLRDYQPDPKFLNWLNREGE
jgi:ribosomal protein L40E